MGFEKSISSAPGGRTRTSRGSSRSEKPIRGRSSGISAGMSLRLCTDRSIRPSRRAWSSSLTKSPLPPTSSSLRSRIRSPVVFMVCSSTRICGYSFFRYSMTIMACRTARLLSRLPMVRVSLSVLTRLSNLLYVHSLRKTEVFSLFHSMPEHGVRRHRAARQSGSAMRSQVPGPASIFSFSLYSGSIFRPR